ncbi:MAG: RHS repeat-associated core domain-containing protein, partial [Deltaproteobacteria bacterium]|nr:RHS repeat-associated core domain-containing protein [Deltaproteobacteria bacterium]
AVNLRAREYYPEYGRFMQEDPIGDRGGSLNWYLYVANNPINWTDPSGYKVVCWDAGTTDWRIKQVLGSSFTFAGNLPSVLVRLGILNTKCFWQQVQQLVMSAYKVKRCMNDCMDYYSWTMTTDEEVQKTISQVKQTFTTSGFWFPNNGFELQCIDPRFSYTWRPMGVSIPLFRNTPDPELRIAQ